MKIVPIKFCLTIFGIIIFCNLNINIKADAQQIQHVPCVVDIIYGDDNIGIITYFILKFQFKNQIGRKINGVSVLTYDNEGQLIGNSDTKCNINSNGIDVGDTGQCEKVLQKISGKMMESIGYDVWIKLLEEQKRELQQINTCKVIGINFSE